ncbi:hypothetical protein VNO78_01791 [Psophocarpus tetragonolobus]|uniref:Uncharacterized protein n=1 Tax=Psophocarpus tetragonolobus TaxID=3891 RepID=A0AAN9XVP6_PSOTE
MSIESGSDYSSVSQCFPTFFGNGISGKNPIRGQIQEEDHPQRGNLMQKETEGTISHTTKNHDIQRIYATNSMGETKSLNAKAITKIPHRDEHTILPQNKKRWIYQLPQI